MRQGRDAEKEEAREKEAKEGEEIGGKWWERLPQPGGLAAL